MIEKVDGESVRDLAHFRSLYEERKSEPSKDVLLEVRRHESKNYVLLKMDRED